MKPVPRDPKLVVALEEVKKFEVDNSAGGTLTGPQAAIVTALREGLTSGKISEEKMEQVQTMIVTLQRESALNAQNKSIQELEALVARSMGMLSKQYEARDRLTEGLRDDLQRVGAEVDLEANGSAVVVQGQQNGVTTVTEVISDEQRAEELAEKRAREEKIALLEAKVEDHNDNEETKDEAKAKVKKTPAKKGYVSARVKKIEGKE